MLFRDAPATTGRWSLVCPWLKRLGVCGFLFFLLKGLLWLIIPALLAYLGAQ